MVAQENSIEFLLDRVPSLGLMIINGHGLGPYDEFLPARGPLPQVYGWKQNCSAIVYSDSSTLSSLTQQSADFVAMVVKPGGFTPFEPHYGIRHQFVLPGYTFREGELQEGATITHCSLDFAYAAREENSEPFTSCRGRFETLNELLENPVQPKGAYHERHNHHGLQNRTEYPQLWLVHSIKPGNKLTSVDLRLMDLVGGAKEFVCPVDKYGVPTGDTPTEARKAEYQLINSLRTAL